MRWSSRKRSAIVVVNDIESLCFVRAVRSSCTLELYAEIVSPLASTKFDTVESSHVGVETAVESLVRS